MINLIKGALRLRILLVLIVIPNFYLFCTLPVINNSVKMKYEIQLKSSSSEIYTYEEIEEYTNNYEINRVKFSANGNYILATDLNPFYHIMHLFRSNLSSIRSYTLWSDIYGMDFSGDGEYIVAINDTTVFLFQNTSSSSIWNSTICPSALRHVVISDNSNYIVAAASSRTPFLFNKTSPTVLDGGDEISRVFKDLIITPDGQYFAAAVFTSDPTFTGFSAVYKISDSHYSSYGFHTYGDVYARSVAISDTADVYVGGYYNRLFYLKSPYSEVWNYSIEVNYSSTEISSDGKYIAATADYLYFFENSSSEPIFQSKEKGFSDVSMSSNGSYIAARGDNKLQIFHKSSSDPIFDYDSVGTINSICLSSDGTQLVAGIGSKIIVFKLTTLTNNVDDDDDDSGDDGEENKMETISGYKIFLLFSILGLGIILILKKKFQYQS